MILRHLIYFFVFFVEKINIYTKSNYYLNEICLLKLADIQDSILKNALKQNISETNLNENPEDIYTISENSDLSNLNSIEILKDKNSTYLESENQSLVEKSILSQEKQLIFDKNDDLSSKRKTLEKELKQLLKQENKLIKELKYVEYSIVVYSKLFVSEYNLKKLIDNVKKYKNINKLLQEKKSMIFEKRKILNLLN